MGLHCRGCGNQEAYMINSFVGGPEYCNKCGGATPINIPDVYVDGKPEINLPDDPRTGKPPVFTSKIDKALYLKKHHLVEYFGREHGGPAIPPSVPSSNRVEDRESVLKALSHVKQMGRDYRRQEYLRIIKERSNS